MKVSIVFNIIAACFNFLLAGHSYAVGNYDLFGINIFCAILSAIMSIFLVVYDAKR